MNVINLVPKEIHAVIEMTSEEVGYLKTFINRSKTEYSGSKEPEVKKAIEYVINVMKPMIDNLADEIRRIENASDIL